MGTIYLRPEILDLLVFSADLYVLRSQLLVPGCKLGPQLCHKIFVILCTSSYSSLV